MINLTVDAQLLPYMTLDELYEMAYDYEDLSADNPVYRESLDRINAEIERRNKLPY